ncbi:hypothetical protein B0H63DRAFT_448702 [Podospora didyma]|uniref:C2H2-type domain-containing protein n=1 Tax=Podospora didyma TaxID=330526 RepID=A0AAE0U1U8_9PEZI|nr:hypothetical protein B0H63DRAFT_448702 [Podospora didyma]
MDASSNTAARAGPKDRERPLPLRSQKDVVPSQSIDRTNSVDSVDSHRSMNFWGRTSTGFSTASMDTTITEPSSPDAATTTFAEPQHLEDTNAPSARPSGSQGFPKPSRASTFASVDLDNLSNPRRTFSSSDNNLIPRHRRLQDMMPSLSSKSRRSSFGKHSAPPSRRGSDHFITPLVSSHPHAKPGLAAGGNSSSDRSASPDLLALHIKDEALNSNILGDVPEESEPSSCIDEHPEAALVFGNLVPGKMAAGPELGPSSQTSHPDSTGEQDMPEPAAHKLDGKLKTDVCDKLLKHLFGVELEDLEVTGTASAAYDAVSYMLDELTHIVPTNSLPSSPFDYNELPTGDACPSNVPIQPHGGGNGGAGSSGGRGSGAPGKRRHNDDDSDPTNQEGSGDNNGGGDGGHNGRKKPKMPEPVDQNLSCPFRKRNPVKFNVRDHQSCAVMSFPDISQLKRHVKNFHKQRSISVFECPRCKRDMRAKEALDNHLAVPSDQICTPPSQEASSSVDPERGITSRIEDCLNGRKANSKIDTWESLWQILFPDDTDAPKSDFVPPIELEEVYVEFQTEVYRDQLSRLFQEEEESSRASDLSHKDPTERVAMLLEIVCDHNEHFFDICRSKTGSLSGRPRRKRNSLGSNKPNSPENGKKHLLTPPVQIPSRKRGGGGANASSSNASSTASSLETNSNGSWANIGQSMVNQSHMEQHNAATIGGYHGSQMVMTSNAGMASLGVAAPATSAIMRPGPLAGQGGVPITVMPPPHLNLDSSNIEQHRRGLQSADSGMGGFNDATGFMHERGSGAVYGPHPDFPPDLEYGQNFQNISAGNGEVDGQNVPPTKKVVIRECQPSGAIGTNALINFSIYLIRS